MEARNVRWWQRLLAAITLGALVLAGSAPAQAQAPMQAVAATTTDGEQSEIIPGEILCNPNTGEFHGFTFNLEPGNGTSTHDIQPWVSIPGHGAVKAESVDRWGFTFSDGVYTIPYWEVGAAIERLSGIGIYDYYGPVYVQLVVEGVDSQGYWAVLNRPDDCGEPVDFIESETSFGDVVCSGPEWPAVTGNVALPTAAADFRVVVDGDDQAVEPEYDPVSGDYSIDALELRSADVDQDGNVEVEIYNANHLLGSKDYTADELCQGAEVTPNAPQPTAVAGPPAAVSVPPHDECAGYYYVDSDGNQISGRLLAGLHTVNANGQPFVDGELVQIGLFLDYPCVNPPWVMWEYVFEDVTPPPANNQPVVEDLFLATYQGVPVDGEVTASDPDGDALEFTYGEASNGSVVDDGSSVTYTPDETWHGSDSFEVTVSDGDLSTTATVYIEVAPLAGESVYDNSECEVLYVSQPILIEPVGAEWQYFINDEMIDLGRHELPAGQYLLTLDVNGQTVDSDEVTVESCSPSVPGLLVERVAGADRYTTAAAVAREGDWAPGGTVYVVTGQSAADALSVSSVGRIEAAGSASAAGPILLTRQASLPGVTRQALQDLAPGSIVVVGGEASVSSAVAAELSRFAPVERIAGADRYETAMLVALAGDPQTVFMATGASEAFADALSAAPLSQWENGAVLFAKRDSLPPSTLQALETLQPERLVVVGGSDRVSNQVASLAAQAAGLDDFDRLAGNDRYATSQQVANQFPADLPTEMVVIASGTVYPDALVAGAWAGQEAAPVLLTAPDALPVGIVATVERRMPSEKVVIVGGQASVSEAVEAKLRYYFE